MKTIKFFLLLHFLVYSSFSQTKSKIALNKAKQAIALMDEGRIDESISILEESQKLDPKNYLYPYEIAYAYVLKKDYKKAIKVIKKVKKLDSINSQVYQLSGNCYSYLGKKDKAIKEYEEGIERFPNAGNLYLEKANVLINQEQYEKAIENYEKGIEVDPNYPSNYYRLALIYLNSSDKLTGLIYGEIFMNLERTTERTREISKALYNTYESSIILGEKESSIDFCELVIDASKLNSENEIQLPFCAIFGKNFVLSILDIKYFNLESLALMRKRFITNFFKQDHKKYSNVLFDYHKKMLDKGYFETYNRYLFQIGAQDEFDEWLLNHKEDFDHFVKWYTNPENIINVTPTNRFKK